MPPLPQPRALAPADATQQEPDHVSLDTPRARHLCSRARAIVARALVCACAVVALSGCAGLKFPEDSRPVTLEDIGGATGAAAGDATAAAVASLPEPYRSLGNLGLQGIFAALIAWAAHATGRHRGWDEKAQDERESS